MGVFDIDAKELPAVRIADAIGRGINKKLLFVVGGGLGDRLCAEPTIRYATKKFSDCEISLLCDTPEVFWHLPFKAVYRTMEEVPPRLHLPLYTYAQGNLANQFFNANLMHSVDFASVSALRMQLPRSEKVLRQYPISTPKMKEWFFFGPTIAQDFRTIVVHPGESWPSRTFPAKWWEEIISSLSAMSYTKVLVVGNKTVNIKCDSRAVDIRQKTDINDFSWICRHANAIVTNDSSPVHFGAVGRAQIAMVATCRRPDLIAHWRRPAEVSHPQFGWNTRDFSAKRMWEMFDECPNNLDKVRIDLVPDGSKIEEFIQAPSEIVSWLK